MENDKKERKVVIVDDETAPQAPPQEFLKPIKVLQMEAIYEGPIEKGVGSLVLVMQDREGTRFATTLLFRDIYQKSVRKTIGRLQGVPLPPITVEDVEEVVVVRDGAVMDANREEGAIAIEPDGI